MFFICFFLQRDTDNPLFAKYERHAEPSVSMQPIWYGMKKSLGSRSKGLLCLLYACDISFEYYLTWGDFKVECFFFYRKRRDEPFWHLCFFLNILWAFRVIITKLMLQIIELFIILLTCAKTFEKRIYTSAPLRTRCHKKPKVCHPLIIKPMLRCSMRHIAHPHYSGDHLVDVCATNTVLMCINSPLSSLGNDEQGPNGKVRVKIVHSSWA